MALTSSNGEFSEARAGIIREDLESNDTECYLIAIYNAKNVNLPSQKPSIEIEAVVVGVVKGKKIIGDKIAFERVSEGGFKEAKTYEGELYYLVCHKIPQEAPKYGGQYHPRAQDPYTMTEYSKDAARVFDACRKQAEQGGADQPATAPESKPSDNSTPNPESKPRPQ